MHVSSPHPLKRREGTQEACCRLFRVLGRAQSVCCSHVFMFSVDIRQENNKLEVFSLPLPSFPQQPDEQISSFLLFGFRTHQPHKSVACFKDLGFICVLFYLLYFLCSVQLLWLWRLVHPLDTEGPVWGERGPALRCRARLCTGFVYSVHWEIIFSSTIVQHLINIL